MTFADWIMRAATNNPPRGREQWAQAMRAEYASLAGGKLSWALGCWTTMLGWRLRADVFYLAALAGFLAILMSGVLFFPEVHLIPRDLVRLGFYPPITELLPICFILGLYRPDRAYVTAFAIFVIPNVADYLQMLAGGWFTDPLEAQTITIHDAPQLVGLMSDIGACLSGALLARALRTAMHRPPAETA